MGSLHVVNDVYVLAFWVLSCNFSYFHLFTFCGMTVHFFVTSLSVNIFLISFKEKLWVVLFGILELKWSCLQRLRNLKDDIWLGTEYVEARIRCIFSGLCKIELAHKLRTNSIMVGFAYILDSNFLEHTFADLGLCKISHIFPLW